MSSKLQQRVREVFNACLRINSTEQRAEVIERECQGDSDLESEVLQLLNFHDADASYLERPLEGLLADQGGDQVAATIATPNPTVSQMTQIGPYKIREQIGEGGMGVVYVAEQSKPVRRKVALKIVKGVGSEQVVARFEAERQALAMMDHPNIARVLDGGAAENGQPYFVMELVQGIPITEYCDEHKLSPRERLLLLTDVCRAVHHAHQKGIIHRDIKPSNVLVAEIDGRAVPKVIDFGVAKATSQKLTDQTIYTQFSQMVGTPIYMSPEQASVGVVDVDTRSDIYSLGVLIYKSLTGSTPFDAAKLKEVGVDEFRRILQEVEPRRPSAMVSTLKAEALSTVAERRKSDPRKLAHNLRGELDWIVMKALEKDRNRRYESAAALSQDIQRFLGNEPVLACPPSAAYRIKKFMVRHQLAVGIATAFFVLVVGGLLTSNYFINQQKLVAQANEKVAKDNATEAEKQKLRAERNLDKALEAVDQLLTRVAEDTLLNEPHMEPLRGKLLSDAAVFCQSLVEMQGDDPNVRQRAALAERQLGRIRQITGDLEGARMAFQASLDKYAQLAKDDPRNVAMKKARAETLLHFGEVLWGQLLHIEAEQSLRDSIGLAGELEKSEVAFDLATRVGMNARNVLSRQLSWLGRLEEAEDLLLENLALFEDIQTGEPLSTEQQFLEAKTQHQLGELLSRFQFRNTEDAEQSLRPALATLRQLGKDDPGNFDYRQELASVEVRLGKLLHRVGRSVEAEEHVNQALEIRKDLWQHHPERPSNRAALAWTHGQLANILAGTGRAADAESHGKIEMDICRELATTYAEVAEFQSALASAHVRQARFRTARGEYESASGHYESGIQLYQNLIDNSPKPEQNAALAQCLEGRAMLKHRFLGQSTEEDFRRAIEIKAELVHQFPDNTWYAFSLGASRGNFANTVADASEVTQLRRDNVILADRIASRYPDRYKIREFQAAAYANLGNNLRSLGKPKEAVQHLEKSTSLAKSLIDDFPGNEGLATALLWNYANTAQCYSAIGEHSKARQILQTAVEPRNGSSAMMNYSPAHRQALASCYSQLAGVLFEQDKAASEEAFEHSVALVRSLMEEHADSTAFKTTLIEALANEGSRQLSAKRYGKAEERMSEAHQLMLDLLEKDPKSQLARRNSGLMLMQLGQIEEARNRWKEAIEKYRESLEYLDQKADRSHVEDRLRKVQKHAK